MSAAEEWSKVAEEHAQAPLDALRIAAREHRWMRSQGGGRAALDRLAKQIEAFDAAIALLEDSR